MNRPISSSTKVVKLAPSAQPSVAFEKSVATSHAAVDHWTQSGAGPAKAVTSTSGLPPPDPALTFLKIESKEAQQIMSFAARTAAQVGVLKAHSTSSTFSDLRPESVVKDELGLAHVRFNRFHEGLPVFGEQVLVHLNVADDGSLSARDVDGCLNEIPSGLSDLPLNIGAVTAECQRVAREQKMSLKSLSHMIYQTEDGTYHAGFLAKLASKESPAPYYCLIDGQTGTVDEQWSDFRPFVPDAALQRPVPEPTDRPFAPPVGEGDDVTLYYGKVDVPTTKAGDNYVMEISDYGTRDGQNSTNPNSATSPSISDPDNTFGTPSDSPRHRGAVDLHYVSEATRLSFLDAGLNGPDGKGIKVVGVVHTGSKYVNAYSTGQINSKGERETFYGDGDDRRAGPLTDITVDPHEKNHITQGLYGGVYSGESGGGMEAASDEFAICTRWFASLTNPAVKFSYIIGEDCWTPGTPGDGLRYMDDPTKDKYSVDHYTNYAKQKEVHGSSGIMNNACYLATHGGKNRTSGVECAGGIDLGDWKKILIRAQTLYYTGRGNFASQAEARLKAATDLFGADWKGLPIMRRAYFAVGVLPE